MSNVDLSKYVGKIVKVTHRDETFESNIVNNTGNTNYPFSISESSYTKDGIWNIDSVNSSLDIVKIEELALASTSNTTQKTISEQDAIAALESIGYKVTLEKKKPILDFDWSCLPKWANKYIAMEDDAVWISYSNLPEYDPKHGVWLSQGGEAIEIPSSFAPKDFCDDWYTIVFKNPNI